MTPLLLFLLGLAAIYVSTVATAFSALMRLSLRLMAERSGRGDRLGRYLDELKTRFPGPIVADMFCLLQLDLELAIRAKGILMARDAGLQVPVDPAVKDRLAERTYLRQTIGKTGLIALRPLMTNAKDDWHEYLLKNR